MAATDDRRTVTVRFGPDPDQVELYERIERERGPVPREPWIREACELALGSPEISDELVEELWTAHSRNDIRRALGAALGRKRRD